MSWLVGAVLAGAAGGLAAHVHRKEGIALPRWNRAVKVLRLGFLHDMVLGAVAAPVGVYFLLAVAAGVTPPLTSSVALGLLLGFAGGPYLNRAAADRLHVNLAADQANTEQVQRLVEAAELRRNTHSVSVEGEDTHGGGARGGSHR